MRPLLLLLPALLVASLASASATPTRTLPVYTCFPEAEALRCWPEEERAPVASDTSRAKSPGRALLLSGGGLLAMGVPVVNLAAIPFGPALGHFYAGNARQAWIGVGIRTGALGLGTAMLIGSALNNASGGEDASEPYLYGVLAVILASGVYDTATAPASARRYNERYGLSALVLPARGGASVRLAVRL